MRRIIYYTAILAGVSLSGCAYVQVRDTALHPDADGFRVYGPKALIVVAGAEVKSAIVPDCSREYAVSPGSFLAKHKFNMKLSNGLITEIDSDQDSTAIPLELIKIVKPGSIGDGAQGLSGKTDGPQGTTADQFGIFEVKCVNGETSIVSVTPGGIAPLVIKPVPPPFAAPTPTPTPTGGDPGPGGTLRPEG
jgi:hypothetical protein